HVTLNVFNILGQKVATLVNGIKTSGNYEVSFDAAKLSTGVYIYRLEAGNNTITKKMTLLK
ncbi:MAG: peptidase S8, partial [Ignavibacteriales bacterium CG18_big_fil_WC_8_21_14_2_50_31_20]